MAALEHGSLDASRNAILVDALPYIDHGYDEPGVREAVSYLKLSLLYLKRLNLKRLNLKRLNLKRIDLKRLKCKGTESNPTKLYN